jgi:AdoMet-dependent heme synthase
MSSKLTMTPWTLLRKEKSGGTLYNTRSNKIYRVDSELHAILSLCRKGVAREHLRRLISAYKSPSAIAELESLVTQLIDADLLTLTPLQGPPVEEDLEHEFKALWLSNDIDEQPDITGPVHVYLEVTHRCNLVCAHCYNNSGPQRVDELSNERIHSLLDEFKELGVFYVSITGGEPLIRPDIFELVAAARENGLRVILATNGTLISPSTADKLANLDVSQVQVSIDSPDARAHNEFRGKPYAFGRAIEGIKLLVERDITVTMSCVVNKLNYQSLPELAELASNLRASYFRVINLMPVGRGLSIVGDCELDYSMRQFVDDQMSRLAKQYDGRISILTGGAENKDPARMADGCGSGFTFCAISATGVVTPCSFSPMVPVGNVNDSAFVDIWEHSASLSSFRKNKQKAIQDNVLRSCSKYGCQAAKCALLGINC